MRYAHYIIIIILFMNYNYKKDNRIYYDFNTKIDKVLKNEINLVKEGSLKNSDIYLFMFKVDNNQVIGIRVKNEKNSNKNLYRFTNRYAKIDKKVYPIIFGDDYLYSTVFYDENGRFTITPDNGYNLTFDGKNNLVDKGFSQ